MNLQRKKNSYNHRFLFYSHNTIGLGHFRRCLLISEALSEHFTSSSILILTGCSVPHMFEVPQRVEYVKVPSLRSNRDLHPSYVPERLKLPSSTVFKLRRSIYRTILAEYLPDLFLVDHSPIGLRMELKEALTISRKLRVKIVASFRDILGDPNIIKTRWEKRGIKKALDTYYDKILVYSSSYLYDFVSNYGLQELKDKIHYCGLIVNKRFRTEERHGKTKPRFLVTVGSGRDGQKLVRKFLNACEYMQKRIDFNATLVLGPLMPKRDREEFLARVHSAKLSNIEIRSFSPTIESEIAQADVVISMGGYNTVAQVLYQKKPLILLPRVSPEKEQLMRAKRIQELGLASVLDQKCTDEDIANSLEDVLEHKQSIKVRFNLPFDGTENTKRICQSILLTK